MQSCPFKCMYVYYILLGYNKIYDNSKCRMSCSCIGMRLVTEIVYVLVRILEGVAGIIYTVLL